MSLREILSPIGIVTALQPVPPSSDAFDEPIFFNRQAHILRAAWRVHAAQADVRGGKALIQQDQKDRNGLALANKQHHKDKHEHRHRQSDLQAFPHARDAKMQQTVDEACQKPICQQHQANPQKNPSPMQAGANQYSFCLFHLPI